MSPAALPVALLAGIALHAGVFHLQLYFRNSERLKADRYFGIAALLICLYDICCMGLYTSTDVSQGAFWQRGQLAILAFVIFSFIFFVDAYTGVRGHSLVRAFAWVFPSVGIVMLFERSNLTLTSEPAIKQLDLPLFGPVVYYEKVVGPLFYVLVVGMVYVTLYTISAAWRARRARDLRRASTISWAAVLLVVGGLNDSLTAAGVFTSFYLLEYAWTSVVMLAGYALSNELLAAAQSKRMLAESKARLAHAERLESVGKLAGGVAHDLNNMLTPVLGYAQLAQDLAPEGTRLRSYLDHLTSAADRAAALTQQLLAFARKQVLEVRPLNLAENIEQLEPLLRRLLPESVALRVELNKQLPLIEADRAQLEQVWMNLAANARDAMPGGGMLRFRVLPEIGPDGVAGVLAIVTDTGSGMSSSVLERAFEPFFSTKTRGKGAGLGLSIVQGIVEQHGGQISVTSLPGAGTTFRLFFPATEKARQPMARARRRADSGSGLRGRERILAVDDDAAVLEFAVEVLEQYGYQLMSAGTRGQLNELLARPDLAEFDLLLTDVILPDIDGTQVRKLVTARFPAIACIYMTGHADEVLAPRGVLREHVELLRKPFTTEELLGKVRAVLEQRTPKSATPSHGHEAPSNSGASE